MDIVQQTINYDVALEILAIMRTTANKARCAATSDEERNKFVEEIKIYNAEQRILDGLSGDDDSKKAVYDKIFKFYAPIVRAR